ncbi:glycosyl transferase [Winogradskya consettensis]|uniref:Glycosyl transferase n=1 Tax=Winogradskya consettensis TaxID=113560 RepID=A0A919T229_9ACTN|nr:hypothetical protein [Actinoplanes consettensis]GIM82019.1 glycosyl transferase [Actinoplanes consettensis]
MARFVVDPDGVITTQVPGDQTWFQWLLVHAEYSVRHFSDPFFSTRQNAPDGVNMMANTSVLGVTVPLVPLTAWFGPRVVYVVWMVGALAGTAATAYWVLQRHLVRSRPAAFVGGLFAGFAPGVVHHANGQPNHVSNFLIPLIVARVLRLGGCGRWVRDGLLLAGLVTWQVFINEETLLIAALACGVAMIAYVVAEPRRVRERGARFLGALTVTGVVTGALCAYPLWFQFVGPLTFTGVPLFATWGEDPAAWLAFARDTIGGGDDAVDRTLGITEQNGWFGWPLVLLTPVLAAMLRRTTAGLVAGMTGVVFALASLGPVIRFAGQETAWPGPLFFVTAETPLLNLMTPGRFAYAVVGCVAVLLALGWDRLRVPRPGLWRLAIVAALYPLLPTPLLAQVDSPPPVFISSGAWRPYVRPGHTMVPVPLPSGWSGRDTLSWSAATGQEFAVPEGYFLGPSDSGEAQLGASGSRLSYLVWRALSDGRAPEITADDVAVIDREIQRWNGSVVVMRAGYEPLRELLDSVLGSGNAVQDVWLWDLRAVESGRS